MQRNRSGYIRSINERHIFHTNRNIVYVEAVVGAIGDWRRKYVCASTHNAYKRKREMFYVLAFILLLMLSLSLICTKNKKGKVGK